MTQSSPNGRKLNPQFVEALEVISSPRFVNGQVADGSIFVGIPTSLQHTCDHIDPTRENDDFMVTHVAIDDVDNGPSASRLVYAVRLSGKHAGQIICFENRAVSALSVYTHDITRKGFAKIEVPAAQ